MKDIAGKLKKTAKLVNGLPGFNKISHELIEKAERLDHKGFTVALFGAFSAGKSSFANALIGEKVLPVSPNPTTAAINKIKPVNDSYHHGTVHVKLKEGQAMLDDINRALKIFDLKAENFNDAITNIEKISGQAGQEGATEKTNYTFLQAFKKGYQAFSNQLGQIIETTIAEFSDFVAKEEKSCFVEWIDLYYDCELTRKGITLVDTPGADSINARHTNVAFDFIKNSDAILFVTYYNHAFSKADREFLIQLGRVKDSFQLDKMFFIINAIDLSDSEEEKNTVIEYVHDQLIKYGVRNPHLYPLSSLNALKEKQEKTDTPKSGMGQFEQAFYHFIANDLANMAMASSENELHRVSQLVGKLIESAKEDAAVKLQKREHMEAEKAKIQSIIKQQRAESLQKRLSQETEELVYYIKQRVFFRFGDFFKEAFNPAVLRDDGRNLKKALQDSLSEFLEEIGYDFAQEMRATTVRLDRFTEKVIAQYQEALVNELQNVNQDLSFSIFEFTNKQEIQFETAFKDINFGLFTKSMSYFKNPRSFFEKNEKKLMSDELNRVLTSPADEYLKAEKERVIGLYNAVIEDVFVQLTAQIMEETDDFYLGLLSALDGGVPTEKLLEIKQELTKL
jgi:GTPase SAR1 family protein